MKASFGWIGIGMGIVIAGASAGALKLRSERPIAVINGEKISRGQFLAQLEAADGANVLRRMIREKLVLQAAAKKGLTPSSSQVQSEIKNLREASPDVDRQLRLHGKTQEDLENDIRDRLAVANLMAADVKLSDADLKQLYAAHQREFNQPEGCKVAMVVAKTSEIADKARASLVAGASAEFVAQDPGMALPGGQSQLILHPGQFPAAVEKQVFAMKAGEVSSVLPLGRYFAVVKLLEKIPAHQKSFDEVKDRLALAVRMRKGKSESELLQSLQKEAKIEFTSDRYKGLADTALAAPLPHPQKLARSK